MKPRKLVSLYALMRVAAVALLCITFGFVMPYLPESAGQASPNMFFSLFGILIVASVISILGANFCNRRLKQFAKDGLVPTPTITVIKYVVIGGAFAFMMVQKHRAFDMPVPMLKTTQDLHKPELQPTITYPPVNVPTTQRGVCNYLSFQQNGHVGGSYANNVTTQECASKARDETVWCNRLLDPRDTGSKVFANQINWGPAYNYQKNPGPDFHILANTTCVLSAQDMAPKDHFTITLEHGIVITYPAIDQGAYEHPGICTHIEFLTSGIQGSGYNNQPQTLKECIGAAAVIAQLWCHKSLDLKDQTATVSAIQMNWGSANNNQKKPRPWLHRRRNSELPANPVKFHGLARSSGIYTHPWIIPSSTPSSPASLPRSFSA